MARSVLHLSAWLPAAVVLAALLTACGKATSGGGAAVDSSPNAREDFVQIDGDTTTAERACLQFGREVFTALAAQNYDAVHGQLSSHATARMSLNQFTPSDDDATFERNEAQPLRNVGLPEFRELMAVMEQNLGRPVEPIDLHVHTSDPAILGGGKREGLDAIDTMFAIGNMPALVPVAQRKASLRGQLRVQLSAEQMAEAAKAWETSVEDLAKDPEFAPYLNLKLVVVEENAQLRGGYFEFLPPSMVD
jgi:hypothetical protein